MSFIQRLRSGNASRTAPRSWNVDYTNTPWSDRPDALDRLAQQKESGCLNDEEYEQLRHWCDDGYVNVPSMVDGERIDAMLHDLDRIWTTDSAIPGLTISGAKVSPDDPQEVPHHRIVGVTKAQRTKTRDSVRWRVHGFFNHSDAARAIFHDAGVKRMADKLLGVSTKKSYTINFMYGSQQKLHQDMMVFAVGPSITLSVSGLPARTWTARLGHWCCFLAHIENQFSSRSRKIIHRQC